MLTIPLVMLAWIPFRSQSIDDTLVMWGHLLSPQRWLFLGLRENSYLIAAILMLSIVLLPAIKSAVTRIERSSPLIFLGAETIALTGFIALVLVYLRPINQFIYFQF